MIAPDERNRREQRIIAAGLAEHYRRSPVVYAGLLCYLDGEYEWEEVLVLLVQKLAVDNARATEELAKFQMQTPSWLHPK